MTTDRRTDVKADAKAHGNAGTKTGTAAGRKTDPVTGAKAGPMAGSRTGVKAGRTAGAKAGRRKSENRERAEGGSPAVRVFRYVIMLLVLIVSVYPILWVFLSSFKEKPGGLGLPEKWVIDGYVTIFTRLNIQTYFFNSIFITCISTVVSVTIVAMAAYVVARMRFKGRGLVTLMFSTTLFIPAVSISFPIYRLLGRLNLKDTRLGIILIYSGLGIAVTYFILQSYFMTIPSEMEEAARVDGCSYTGTFFKIILPIAKPGLATAAIMAMLNNWNEFYFASILLKSPEKMTIPALLGQFTSAYSKNLNGMFSAIIVAVVPTIVVFCLLSETFVKSLTAGAVKG